MKAAKQGQCTQEVFLTRKVTFWENKLRFVVKERIFFKEVQV